MTGYLLSPTTLAVLAELEECRQRAERLSDSSYTAITGNETVTVESSAVPALELIPPVSGPFDVHGE